MAVCVGMRVCVCGSGSGPDGRFRGGLVDSVQVWRHRFSTSASVSFSLSFQLSVPLLLSLAGQEVGVVLQTVHVRQQQLCGFQGQHVLQVIVLFIPGRVGLGRAGGETALQGGCGDGGGWEERGEREGGSRRKGDVVRIPVVGVIRLVG